MSWKKWTTVLTGYSSAYSQAICLLCYAIYFLRSPSLHLTRNLLVHLVDSSRVCASDNMLAVIFNPSMLLDVHKSLPTST
jgi:hypothetical protein